MTVDLVLFDCDGVLVDSEPISIDVLREIIGSIGVEIPEDEMYLRFLGRSMASIGQMLRNDYGADLTDDLLATMRERLFTRFRAELQPVPGMANAIREGQGRLWHRQCVASSSQPDRIRLSLSVTGLFDLFDPDIFSATMVKRGKPEPDLFLYAAGQMNVSATGCVVVEDSTAGMRAAKAAGMAVIAFTGGAHAYPARLRDAALREHPDAIVEHAKDLPEALSLLA
ncbi:HAD family hydrolase [Qingshengfaniella alkalisoli]|uniref:HAD family hydrolase n=1 Tax=Qingshengfaniella alkalisoli TaxID=2599296 RepID=A0A5B8IZY6_9RHOB|nr:HAD family hydrolase [Qingshengfaniella alkalisoli]QDY71113.1 HAD family hydrolase [Qingshengfaniella alkalisoli]